MQHSRIDLLEIENIALRRHAKNLSTMLDLALVALQEANGKVADEYMRRRDAENKLAGLRNMNLTCEYMGIRPMYVEN